VQVVTTPSAELVYHGGQTHLYERLDVFHEDERRSAIVDDPEEIIERAAAGILESLSHTQPAEALAWKATDHYVGVLETDVLDVVHDGGLWELPAGHQTLQDLLRLLGLVAVEDGVSHIIKGPSHAADASIEVD
jgi:hypothetical protein